MRKLLVCLCVSTFLFTFVGIASAAQYTDTWLYNGSLTKDLEYAYTFDLVNHGSGFNPETETISSAQILLSFGPTAQQVRVTVEDLMTGETQASTFRIQIVGDDGLIFVEVESLVSLNEDGTLKIVLKPKANVYFEYGVLVANTATPEPTSMLLLGSGLVSLGLWSKRRKKRSASA